MDPVVNILLWLLVIFAGAWIAHWVVLRFIPKEMHTPALFVVGVLLLICIILVIMRGGPLTFQVR